ncbi:MAG: hypothetical protein AAFU71_13695 [Cyanobacteria bacterium J06632_22]
MSFPSSPSTTTSDLSLLIKLATLPQSTSSTPFSSKAIATTRIQQPVVGQYFDQDFFGSSGEILTNFVESGQIWALLIGIVLGYLIRGLTTY